MSNSIEFLNFSPSHEMHHYVHVLVNKVWQASPYNSKVGVRLIKTLKGFLAQISISSGPLSLIRHASGAIIYSAIDRVFSQVDLDIQEWRENRTF